MLDFDAINEKIIGVNEFYDNSNPSSVDSLVATFDLYPVSYIMPNADIAIEGGSSRVSGIFGCYRSLYIKTNYDVSACSVLAQDLADTESVNITNLVTRTKNGILLPGELIACIGTEKQPEGDTSESGLVLVLEDSTLPKTV